MAWATTSDVTSYTGQTVTNADITMAQALVEMYAEVTEDANTNLSTRDLRLLKMAVAYQTTWMVNQVDVFTRTNVTDLDQDGMVVKYRGKEARVVAPLAQRCIERLSWMTTRSIAVAAGPRIRTIEQYHEAWLKDQEDGPYVWASWNV